VKINKTFSLNDLHRNTIIPSFTSQRILLTSTRSFVVFAQEQAGGSWQTEN